MRQLERRRYISAGGSEGVAGLAQRRVIVEGEARHKPGRGVEAVVQERSDDQGAEQRRRAGRKGCRGSRELLRVAMWYCGHADMWDTVRMVA